jgi:hypothetical protein
LLCRYIGQLGNMEYNAANVELTAIADSSFLAYMNLTNGRSRASIASSSTVSEQLKGFKLSTEPPSDRYARYALKAPLAL